MKALLLVCLGFATPVLAAPGQAALCPDLAWTEAKTAAPTPADIAGLQCWTRAGDPTAGYMLAMLTKAGRGVVADPAEARRLLGLLANGQSGGSITGGLSSRVRSFNLDPVSRFAEDLMVAAYPPAMRELAKMQLLGKGGDVDMSAAMGWLEKARDSDREAGILYSALKAKGY